MPTVVGIARCMWVYPGRGCLVLGGKCSRELFESIPDLGERLFLVQPQGDEHLVVSRSRRVDLFPHFSLLRDEVVLDSGVAVLLFPLDDEITFLPELLRSHRALRAIARARPGSRMPIS